MEQRCGAGEPGKEKKERGAPLEAGQHDASLVVLVQSAEHMQKGVSFHGRKARVAPLRCALKNFEVHAIQNCDRSFFVALPFAAP